MVSPWISLQNNYLIYIFSVFFFGGMEFLCISIDVAVGD